ncbi:TPA: hypothetical protein JEL57_004162 [Salmonella enterica subsp. enterica serovar Casablanca]|nr:hypothetical protein [Salmonella enterica subsp. enterica serovar Casablanca]
MMADKINIAGSYWSDLKLMAGGVPLLDKILIFSSRKTGKGFSLVTCAGHNLWAYFDTRKTQSHENDGGQMESLLSSEREIRRRVSGILSNFPHKKMQEWLVREKSGISSGNLKDAKNHFYFLLEDTSPEGTEKRRQLWSWLQKKYPEAIISLFFFLGSRGHHLYKKAVAGDCYAAVVLLSLMEELNKEV